MAANSLIDVRPILPDVKQHTLVIQRRHDQMVRRGNGRYFADNIVNATYLELPTSSHLPQFEDTDIVLMPLLNLLMPILKVNCWR